ncbi:MAG: hypothetical protein AAFW67_08745 [Cyanobacteria bacterium J06638_38]
MGLGEVSSCLCVPAPLCVAVRQCVLKDTAPHIGRVTCGRSEASPKGYRFAYALVQALCRLEAAVEPFRVSRGTALTVSDKTGLTQIKPETDNNTDNNFILAPQTQRLTALIRIILNN